MVKFRQAPSRHKNIIPVIRLGYLAACAAIVLSSSVGATTLDTQTAQILSRADASAQLHAIEQAKSSSLLDKRLPSAMPSAQRPGSDSVFKVVQVANDASNTKNTVYVIFDNEKMFNYEADLEMLNRLLATGDVKRAENGVLSMTPSGRLSVMKAVTNNTGIDVATSLELRDGVHYLVGTKPITVK